MDKINVVHSTKPTLKDTSNLSPPKKDIPKGVSWNDSPRIIKPESDRSSQGKDNKVHLIPAILKSAEMEAIVEPDCKQQ